MTAQRDGTLWTHALLYKIRTGHLENPGYIACITYKGGKAIKLRKIYCVEENRTAGGRKPAFLVHYDLFLPYQ